jgi:DNA-directed RNA polymerase sigma subunit (sigma70/sigma32)
MPNRTPGAGVFRSQAWGRARERTILAMRYGLTGELPVTLREIGRRLHMSREWVRKIEIKAVRKLRD